MLAPFTVLGVFVLYMAFLFLIALWVERQALVKGRNIASNPVVYALSLTVYCTSWTYFGSVGKAVSAGPMFLGVFIGPSLSILLWWTVLRKLVRIKSIHRITSIADFLSARYDRSNTIAALTTAGAFVGIMPYIALQLKSIISTFAVIAPAAGNAEWISGHVGPIVVVLMIGFTIVFGVRRIDPTERHQGIVMAVAVESVVKLVAFLAAGILVTYFLYDGFGDIFDRISRTPYRGQVTRMGGDLPYATWASHLILSMCAVLFLPRQFHISVVENFKEKHILSAVWMFPLYLLLINIFVAPIAMAGLLEGLSAEQADTFVLRLPMAAGNPLLSLLVFIGGASAATSMIMISAMTMSTMIANHLLLPLLEWIRGLGFLRRYMLQCRWAAVALFILMGYWFEHEVGAPHMLANIGIISFAAALQFAPAILLGIFWREANKAGAILGMGAGFAVWFYTMLLPFIARSGWLSENLIRSGPAGLGFLRPEQLFGITMLDPASHTVFWSLFFNIGLLVLGSLCFAQSKEENRLAASFVDALSAGKQPVSTRPEDPTIDFVKKRQTFEKLLSPYFSVPESEAICRRCAESVGIKEKQWISIMELANLVDEVETILAGSFGSSGAHRIINRARIFTEEETTALKALYSDILAEMHIGPEEMKQKIDYYREREALFNRHARELGEKIAQRDNEIAERKRFEKALRQSEAKYRSIFENAVEGIFQTTPQGRFIRCNPAMARILGYDSPEELIGKINDIKTQVYVDPQHRESFLRLIRQRQEVNWFEVQFYRKDGSITWVSLHARPGYDQNGQLVQIEGIATDISDLKRAEKELRALNKELEQRVAERTAELKAAYNELKDFAYVVSHDLKSPLRSVHQLAGWISQDYADVLDERGRQYLNLLTGRVKRLHGFIDGILTYSRVGRVMGKSHPVDCNRIVDDVIQALSPSADIQVTVENELPVLFGEKIRFQQLFQNLIGNAVNYMDKDGGEVKIGCEAAGSGWKFHVTDNGPGIEEKYHEKIFQIFQTLTSRDESESTGMGLTIARKIVAHYGGRIWVESKPGRGSSFFFTLPRTGPHEDHQNEKP